MFAFCSASRIQCAMDKYPRASWLKVWLQTLFQFMVYYGIWVNRSHQATSSRKHNRRSAVTSTMPSETKSIKKRPAANGRECTRMKKPAKASKKRTKSKLASKKTLQQTAQAAANVEETLVMPEAQKKFWQDRNIDPSQVEPSFALLEVHI